MSKKPTIRVPGLDPRGDQQLVGGVRQSVANGDQHATSPQVDTEPSSGTIRSGRPVKRVVRKVLQGFGLSAHRGHG